MKARQEALLMNALDTERSVEPKETLVVLEWVRNATRECFVHWAWLYYKH